MDRRQFLMFLAASGMAATFTRGSEPDRQTSDRLGKILPKRKLGKTGEMVTVLGLGGYHIGWTSEELAQATIERALEEGVRFFDTAESYGPGISEERYGRYLTPRYRDDVFLMTKTMAGDAATASAHLDASLKRLATDRLDLWQIHHLKSPEDVDNRISQGVVEFALEAKQAGKVRHIGFTGHASPAAHRHMLEQAGDKFATCQMPINPVDAASDNSFIKSVLPRLGELNFGVLAMKSLADGRFFARKVMNEKLIWESDKPVVPDRLSVADCIHFTLSLPISVLITGAENPDMLSEKTQLVRRFQALTDQDRVALIDKVLDHAAAGRVEYYKS